MQQSKHTPGPWSFSRNDQYGDARFYIAQAEGAPYTPDFSDVAALLAVTVPSERLTIQEANARLIAAAPELMEALMSATAVLREFSFKDDAITGALEKSHAAIAKATGAKQ